MIWENAKLGDLASFINGYPFKPSEWSSDGLEIIRIQNLTKGSVESNYFTGTIPEKYKVLKGDILISWSATLDIYVWEGKEAWLNQHIFKVVFDKKEIDKRFFIYLIKHILDDMKKEVHGATMKHITKGKFDNMPVPLPPLPVQKCIAEILDAADALKRKDQELLKKYDELAQAIFIDMFGDPVKNEKGWEITTLGQTCHYIKDGPHVSPKYTQNGIPFISVNNIIKGEIDISNCKFVSKEDYEIYSKKGKPEKNDILYTKGGTTGFAKKVDVDFDFVQWVHVALLKFDQRVLNSTFLESMLNSSFCYHQSQLLTKGIANRDLVLGEIKKIQILLPPIDLQISFEDKLTLIYLSKYHQKITIKDSDNLFSSLIQEAFNGSLVS